MFEGRRKEGHVSLEPTTGRRHHASRFRLREGQRGPPGEIWGLPEILSVLGSLDIHRNPYQLSLQPHYQKAATDL